MDPVERAKKSALPPAVDALPTGHDGGEHSPSFQRDLKTGKTTVDWSRVQEALIRDLRKGRHPVAPERIHAQLVINGEEIVRTPPGTTSLTIDTDPADQLDLRVEFFAPWDNYDDYEAPRPSDFVHRSHVTLVQARTDRIVDAESFTPFGVTSVSLPSGFVKETGIDPGLTQVATELSHKKIVYVPDEELRQRMKELGEGTRVVANFDDQRRLTGAHLVAPGGVTEEVPLSKISIKGDAAFNDNSFHWDDTFWALATAYRARTLAESTLDFWYDVQERHGRDKFGDYGGLIPREVRSNRTSFHHFWDPQAGTRKDNTELTNPNLMGWAEWDLYALGRPEEAKERLPRAIASLEEEIGWIERNRSVIGEDGEPVFGAYWTSNLGSGMDNQPRAEGHDFSEVAWVDVLAQQILKHRMLARMHAALGQWDEMEAVAKKEQALAQVLDREYWNDELGLYVDRIPDGAGGLTPDDNPSIATFWAMLALGDRMSSPRAQRFVNEWMTPERFGGDFPFPSLPRDHKDFDPAGGYWRGGHWPNMQAVASEALGAIGFGEMRQKTSLQTLARMDEASPAPDNPARKTVYELYGEEIVNKRIKGRPGRNDRDDYTAKADFAGWGLVPPLYGMLTSVIGLRPVPGFAGAGAELDRWLTNVGSHRIFAGSSHLTPDLLSAPGVREKVRQGYLELNLALDPSDEGVAIRDINYPGHNRIESLEVKRVGDVFEIRATSEAPFQLQLNRAFGDGASAASPVLGQIVTVGGKDSAPVRVPAQ